MTEFTHNINDKRVASLQRAVLTVYGIGFLVVLAWGFWGGALGSPHLILYAAAYALAIAAQLLVPGWRRDFRITAVFLALLATYSTAFWSIKNQGMLVSGGGPLLAGAAAMAITFPAWIARSYVYVTTAIAAIVVLLSPYADTPFQGDIVGFARHSRLITVCTLIALGIFVVQVMRILIDTGSEAIQSLEERQEAQARMFAIIGHELRTPIANLHLIATEGNLETQQAEVIAATQRLLRVVDDLKAAASPEVKMEIVERPFAIPALLAELRSSLKAEVERSMFKLIIEDKVPAGFEFNGDMNRIATIVGNLCRNALRHSGGAQLRVLTEFEDVGHTLRITVEDNGVGINPNELEKLFAPYVRGDSKAEGTGLGLHITRSWTWQLGGEITYKPAPQGGSRFVVSLPGRLVTANEQFETEDDRLAAAKERLSGKTILLVEDERMMQTLHAKQLKRLFDCTVEVAADGAHALEMMVDKAFELIVTDYFMPTLDGRDLIRAIRHSDKHLPIIGVTAATIGQEMTELISAGASEVLSKPLEPNEFAEAVIKVMPAQTNLVFAINCWI